MFMFSVGTRTLPSLTSACLCIFKPLSTVMNEIDLKVAQRFQYGQAIVIKMLCSRNINNTGTVKLRLQQAIPFQV
jgi:hypothetical protein